MYVQRFTLHDTVYAMEATGSWNYKKRFLAEYFQTKIRYEKLKAFNTKIEAGIIMKDYNPGINPSHDVAVKEPAHDCPAHVLKRQEEIMKEYLDILELRATFEDIALDYLPTEPLHESPDCDGDCECECCDEPDKAKVEEEIVPPEVPSKK